MKIKDIIGSVTRAHVTLGWKSTGLKMHFLVAGYSLYTSILSNTLLSHELTVTNGQLPDVKMWLEYWLLRLVKTRLEIQLALWLKYLLQTAHLWPSITFKPVISIDWLGGKESSSYVLIISKLFQCWKSESDSSWLTLWNIHRWYLRGHVSIPKLHLR